MAKQTPLLCKTFAADTAIANASVCVVMSGSNAGNVSLPAAALATKFVGVVVEPASSSAAWCTVGVQVAGIAQVQTDGSAAIVAGDYVAIGNASGQVRSVSPASGTVVRQVVGIALSAAANTAGLLVDVLLQPAMYVGA